MSVIDLRAAYKQYIVNPSVTFKDVILEEKHRNMIDITSIIRVSTYTIFQNNLSLLSYLSVTTNSIINTFRGYKDLYCYGKQVNNNNFTINNKLYCTGYTTILSNITTNKLLIFNTVSVLNNLSITKFTVFNNLNINNNYYTQYLTSKSGFLNQVVSQSIYTNKYINNGNISCSGLIFSHSDIICNNVTSNNTLYIGSNVVTNNLITTNLTGINININNGTINNILNSNTLNIISDCLINSSCTLNSDLYVENNATLNNANFTNIILDLPNYPSNTVAALNNIPLYGLYRNGDVVNIRLPVETPIIKLNGFDRINIFQNSNYDELGVSCINSVDPINLIITGTVDTSILGEYILSYYCIDSLNNISNTVTRYVNIVSVMT